MDKSSDYRNMLCELMQKKTTCSTKVQYDYCHYESSTRVSKTKTSADSHL